MSRFGFERSMRAREDLATAEKDGVVADSHEVRLALIARMKAGELTLDQVQAELKRIQRTAKASGKVTRNQAFLGRRP